MTDFESQGASDKGWFYAKHKEVFGKLPNSDATHVFMDRVGKYLQEDGYPDDRIRCIAYDEAWEDYLDDIAGIRLGNGG